MLKEVDSDGSMEIDFEGLSSSVIVYLTWANHTDFLTSEFKKVMSYRAQLDYSPEEVKRAFKTFKSASDKGPSGRISVADLTAGLKTWGKLSEDDIKDLLAQVTVNQGLVNYEEYVDMMMASSSNKTHKKKASRR
jgi:Ca2+-binding EF-hand superfamily protein